MSFPAPDTNNIINLLPENLSAANEKNRKQFRFFALFYDPVMRYFIRSRIHKADPLEHQRIWRQLVGSVHNARILDLACGTGGLIACMEKDNDYTGLDLSYQMLKKAAGKTRTKGFTSYRLIWANAEMQVFPANSFDLVTVDTALHMVPDWQGAMSAAAQCLSCQGVLMAAVPVLGIDKEFDKVWRKYARGPQFHGLTRDDLQQACSANNLDFSCVDTNGGMLYFRAQKKEG